LLNLPVHGPARPAPAHPLLRAAPVRREPLSPHGHHLSDRGAAGRRLPARAWHELGGGHPRRPRGVPGRPALPPQGQHRRDLPQGPQDPLRLAGRGRGDPGQPDGQDQEAHRPRAAGPDRARGGPQAALPGLRR
jgi:hypothetical protein